MIKNKLSNNKSTRFTQWSRKTWAIFASLSHEVQIGFLKISTVVNSLIQNTIIKSNNYLAFYKSISLFLSKADIQLQKQNPIAFIKIKSLTTYDNSEIQQSHQKCLKIFTPIYFKHFFHLQKP